MTESVIVFTGEIDVFTSSEASIPNIDQGMYWNAVKYYANKWAISERTKEMPQSEMLVECRILIVTLFIASLICALLTYVLVWVRVISDEPYNMSHFWVIFLTDLFQFIDTPVSAEEIENMVNNGTENGSFSTDKPSISTAEI